MIIVTGSILAREDIFDDVLRSCLEHVERPAMSRAASRMTCMSTA